MVNYLCGINESITRSGRLLRARHYGLAALIVASGLTACNKADDPVVAPSRVARAIVVEPASLVLPAGDQWQLAAEINDDAGQPVGGAAIIYRSGNGAIARVESSGLVTSIGPAGTTFIEVVHGVLSTRVSLTVTPGAAAALELVNTPAATAVAGAAVGQIEIRTRDPFGNGVGDVPLQWRVTTGEGSVESASGQSDVNGMASAQWVTGVRVGPQVIEVRSAELAPLVVQTAAIPGPPAALALEPDPSVGDAAFPIGTSLSVKALPGDRHGNPVESATIVFEAPQGCRLEAISRTATTDRPAGVDWPLTSAGACELRARVEGFEVDARLVVHTRRPR